MKTPLLSGESSSAAVAAEVAAPVTVAAGAGGQSAAAIAPSNPGPSVTAGSHSAMAADTLARRGAHAALDSTDSALSVERSPAKRRKFAATPPTSHLAPVVEAVVSVLTPVTAPTSTPATTPTPALMKNSAPAPSPAPAPAPAPASTTQSSTPVSAPASTPVSAPASAPDSAPAAVPDSAPAAVPDSAPAAVPDSAPAAVPDSAPASVPAPAPTPAPVSAPASAPTTALFPGPGPTPRPGTLSVSASGAGEVPPTVHAPWQQTTARRTVVCPVPNCGKSYTQDGSLKRHLKAAHDEDGKYVCGLDGCKTHVFTEGHRQRHHRAVHEGIREFLCGCGKGYVGKRGLEGHAKKCEVGRREIEERMSDAVAGVGGTVLHSGAGASVVSAAAGDGVVESPRVSSGVPATAAEVSTQPSAVEVAPPSAREVKRRKVLKSSARQGSRASAPKKFVCEVGRCGMCFTQAGTLRRHTQAVHNGDAKFVCGVDGCRTMVLGNYDRHRHQVAVHEKRKDFLCRVCGMRFARANALKRHGLTHWNEVETQADSGSMTEIGSSAARRGDETTTNEAPGHVPLDDPEAGKDRTRSIERQADEALQTGAKTVEIAPGRVGTAEVIEDPRPETVQEAKKLAQVPGPRLRPSLSSLVSAPAAMEVTPVVDLYMQLSDPIVQPVVPPQATSSVVQPDTQTETGRQSSPGALSSAPSPAGGTKTSLKSLATPPGPSSSAVVGTPASPAGTSPSPAETAQVAAAASASKLIPALRRRNVSSSSARRGSRASTPKKFACDVVGCGMCYTQIGTLRRHVRAVHNCEPQFVCGFEGCMTRVSGNYDRVRHMTAVHEKRKDYVCSTEGCGKGFARKSHLARHHKEKSHGDV